MLLKLCINRRSRSFLIHRHRQCINSFNHKFDMSKQKHTKKDNVKNALKSTVCLSQDLYVTLDKSKNIMLNILAKPGAKQNKITEITVDGVGVQISAPPTDGEANTELVKFISGILGLRKSDVTLEKGFKSRQKTLKIAGDSIDIERIKEKIKQEIDE